jgi:hypothetical protein
VLEEQLRADWRRDVCVAGFAIPGGGPVHSLVLLGRLLRDDLTPDLLLIEVLPSHLRAAELAGVFPKGSIHLSAADRDWLQQHGLAPAADPEDPAQSGGPACWRYRSAVVRRLYPRLQAGAPTWVWRADPWGSSRSPKAATSEAERRHATQRARNQYAAALKGLRLPGPGAAALRAILSECQRRGIPSALVLMPEGPEFRSWYRDKAREEVREMLGRMARECESRLIDAWEWYEEEAFADSHHLLADSARDLSARLGREVAAADQHSPTPIADRGADGALRR